MKLKNDNSAEKGLHPGNAKEQPRSEKVDRRNFLSVASAAGIVGAAEILRSTSSRAQEPARTATSVPRLPSIEKLIVSKEEALDIPGGKEHFYEWEASDDQGVTSKFLVHGWRTESGDTYTVTTDVTVHRFAAGADLSKAPHASSSQRMILRICAGYVKVKAGDMCSVMNNLCNICHPERSLRLRPIAFAPDDGIMWQPLPVSIGIGTVCILRTDLAFRKIRISLCHVSCLNRSFPDSWTRVHFPI